MNLQEKSGDIYSIIDHAEKVEPVKTEEALTEIGLNEDEKAKIIELGIRAIMGEDIE